MNRRVFFFKALTSLFIAAAIFSLSVMSSCSAQTPAGTSAANSDSSETSSVNSSNKIELSGNSDDIFIAENNCYAEGEKVILFFQKGVTVRGDMIKVTEEIMDDLCELTGLDFFGKHPVQDESYAFEMYFDKNAFSHELIMSKKIHMLIVDLSDGTCEWAMHDGAVVASEDYIFSDYYYSPLYHELAHVIQFRSGIGLGGSMNEGYAVYITDMAMRAHKYPSWYSVSYYYPGNYDDSSIALGEEGFLYTDMNNYDNSYQYGFRFINFLCKTYGNDTYNRILNEAEKQNFDEGYIQDEDIKKNAEQLKQIIKSVTSEDVFERFASWYRANWENEMEEYREYLNSLGLEF